MSTEASGSTEPTTNSTSSSARVQIVGNFPPRPSLPANDAAQGSDSDDDQNADEQDEDPQTEDEQEHPSTNGASPSLPSGYTTTQFGAVTVAQGNTNGQVTEAPRDEIPDDTELLAQYPDTEEILDLSHLRISTTRNLGLPRFQKSVKKLCLRQNEIPKIRSKDIGVLTELVDLDLYDNSIEKISGLDECTKLESLDLSFNNIRHISNVSHLANCKTIYFVQNKISKVRPDDLKGPIADSLTSLELGGNRLRSIENIDHLIKLTELWLGKNKITSLQGLAPLVNLRVLSIQSNRITKLGGLSTLTNLEEFYVSHNGLTKLEGLESNLKLRTLDISGNIIEKIENVSHLNEMEEFWANDNKIANLNDLESQLGPDKMPKLETVYLEGNPTQRSEAAAYRRKVKLALPQISQIDATYVR